MGFSGSVNGTTKQPQVFWILGFCHCKWAYYKNLVMINSNTSMQCETHLWPESLFLKGCIKCKDSWTKVIDLSEV